MFRLVFYAPLYYLIRKFKTRKRLTLFTFSCIFYLYYRKKQPIRRYDETAQNFAVTYEI